MHMIAHQGPSEAESERFGEEPAEAEKKILVIRNIAEDGGAIDPSHDDMVKSAGRVDAGFKGHGS
jgi:hypothetical protein